MASLSGPLPTMRAMCAAKDENHILVGADFKQLELWTMYAITGDEVLGEGLKKGDVYTEDAKFLFSLPAHMKRCKCEGLCRDPLNHVKPKARQDGKISHLTFQYGAELATFYRGLLESDQDMAFSTAALLHAGMRKRYKRTVEWWYEEYELVCSRGWSESRVLGARKTYPSTPELQSVVNWPNQTTAAEVHGLAWLTLGSGRKGRPGTLARFKGEALLIKQWYDAFLVECRREIKDEVAEVVREAMEQSHIIEGREWSFKADVKPGRRESDV
jgi:hypothetical protein